MWKKFDPTAIRGISIIGDHEVPPTTWWNIHWLKYFVWKTAAIFRISPADAERGYCLGYKAIGGTGRLLTKVLKDQEVAVRVGRENCTFFAIGPEGREIRMSPYRLTAIPRINEQGIRLV